MKTTQSILTGLALLVTVTAGSAVAAPRSRGRAIRRWITQLHASGYAKRNAAVEALALKPRRAEAALPRLEQKLKTETKPNRRWWLKAAIQQCRMELPKPGAIFASPNRSHGLDGNAACQKGDGPFSTTKYHGVRCWKTPGHPGKAWSYLYFKTDPAFRQKAGSNLEIQLKYLDQGTGDIGLDYDSSNPRAAVHGAYENHPLKVRRLNTGQWRTVRFSINNARFHGSENGGSDFRFSIVGNGLLVCSVEVWPVPPSR